MGIPVSWKLQERYVLRCTPAASVGIPVSWKLQERYVLLCTPAASFGSQYHRNCRSKFYDIDWYITETAGIIMSYDWLQELVLWRTAGTCLMSLMTIQTDSLQKLKAHVLWWDTNTLKDSKELSLLGWRFLLSYSLHHTYYTSLPCQHSSRHWTRKHHSSTKSRQES